MRTWWTLMLVGCGGTEVGAPMTTPVADESLQPVDLATIPSADALEGWDLQVFPATDNIPSNVRTISIDFGTGMALGRPQSRLYTASGKLVPDAIEKVRWNGPIEEVTFLLGELEVGAKYALVVNGMATSDQKALPQFQHPFRVFPPDTEAPDGDGLILEGDPIPGSLNAMTIRFPEPMGAASLDGLTLLVDGKQGDGTWTLEEHGTLARYTPGAPWSDGVAIAAGVSGGVVDVAGNAMVNAPERMLKPARRVAP